MIVKSDCETDGSFYSTSADKIPHHTSKVNYVRMVLHCAVLDKVPTTTSYFTFKTLLRHYDAKWASTTVSRHEIGTSTVLYMKKFLVGAFSVIVNT